MKITKFFHKMKQDLNNQSKEQNQDNLKKGEKKVKAADLLMMAMFFIKT